MFVFCLVFKVEDGTFLCAALPNKISVLRFNSSMNAFVIRKVNKALFTQWITELKLSTCKSTNLSPFCRHHSLSWATIRHHVPSFVTIRHHSSAFAIIRHHSPSCTTIRHHAPPFATIRHHSPPFLTIRHHSSPFAIMRHHSPSCVTVRHHSPWCVTCELNVDNWNDNCEAKSEAKVPGLYAVCR